MLRILLINDTPKKVGRLKSALIEAGFEVIDESGLTIDLPARVETVRPDVILIDTESPGRDVMEQVVLVSRDQPRPIVMLTDEHDPDVMRQAIKSGVRAFQNARCNFSNMLSAPRQVRFQRWPRGTGAGPHALDGLLPGVLVPGLAVLLAKNGRGRQFVFAQIAKQGRGDRRQLDPAVFPCLVLANGQHRESGVEVAYSQCSQCTRAKGHR